MQQFKGYAVTSLGRDVYHLSSFTEPRLLFARQIEQTCGQRVSPATLCRVIRSHGFTRKKLNHIAKQRSLVHRGEYLAEIQLYRRDCFAFVDETRFNSKDHTRRFIIYAMRGENACDIRWLH